MIKDNLQCVPRVKVTSVLILPLTIVSLRITAEESTNVYISRYTLHSTSN